MKIHTRYGFKGEKSQFDLILNAFIFGVLSYAIVYLIYRCKGWSLEIFELDTQSNTLLDQRIFPEIIAATVVSIIGGILTLYVENYKIFTRFVQWIGATKTYGDEDVWDFVLNSPSPAVEFIHFRDFDQRVTYAGFVDKFSESGQLRELVLRDVDVYDFEGNLMYSLPRLYISRDRTNIHIEFPRRD